MPRVVTAREPGTSLRVRSGGAIDGDRPGSPRESILALEVAPLPKRGFDDESPEEQFAHVHRRVSFADRGCVATGPSRRRSTRKFSFAPPTTIRQKIYSLMDPTVPAASPQAAQAATVLSIVLFLLIFLSIVVFCIESHPMYYRKSNKALLAIEATCVGIFTCEFLLKFATCEDRADFSKSILNWVDVVSILPWYVVKAVELSSSSSSGLDSLVFLRVIRLARVFRVFKLGKYYKGIQLVIYAMRQSSEALSLLGFLLGICLVLFASLVFIAEQSQSSFHRDTKVWLYDWNYSANLSDVPKKSQFQSIPDSLWWSLVTLATVGYGDQIPRTWAGKGVGMLAMTVGVLVLAFPIILISNNFSEAVKEYNQNQQDAKAALEVYREEQRLLSALGQLTEEAVEPAPDIFPPPAQAASLMKTLTWPAAAQKWPSLASHIEQGDTFTGTDGQPVAVSSEWVAQNWPQAALDHWRVEQYLAKLCQSGVWGVRGCGEGSRGPSSALFGSSDRAPMSPLLLPPHVRLRDPSPSSSPVGRQPSGAERQSPALRGSPLVLTGPAFPPLPEPPDDLPVETLPPAVTEVQLVTAPPPEPGLRTVVANFVYANKRRPVYYVSRVGDMHNFRYDPLFVRDGTADGSDSDGDGDVLHVDVLLDCDDAQDEAVSAVRKSGLFTFSAVRKQNTFALQLAKITLSIPLLHPTIRLLTREFASPGNTFTMQLAADGPSDLDALRKRLPEYAVRCQCATNFGSRPPSRGNRYDYEVTVPLMGPTSAAPITVLNALRISRRQSSEAKS